MMYRKQFFRCVSSLACSLALLLAAAASPQNAHWVATWATSPSFPYADGP
jgi:hypothetical protein